eukprot:CAMPEP_0113553596 /NCGR_PEP_ID=MMETSP0015_2-20120614/15700_1 /TAXON_ID=2838 /ORGANISM="Odontella" /LENGTH=643 /DNA_ID=CAMNT_0000454681 /DNA_START=219 /DNA_END=2150 /DNA_ORIENTATION=- /assembly_acc=CAM_ASM_000160
MFRRFNLGLLGLATLDRTDTVCAFVPASRQSLARGSVGFGASTSTSPVAPPTDEEDNLSSNGVGANLLNPPNGEAMDYGDEPIDDEELISLPRHSSNGRVSNILEKAETVLRGLHRQSVKVQDALEEEQIEREESSEGYEKVDATSGSPANECVFANSYINLGRVETIGFDYDYTLVTYRPELLELIYDMALKRLVNDKQYPVEMLHADMAFDPHFSIRGLAVDRETGWICHLSYTHKVAVAWEGRNKVKRNRLFEEYSGKRALRPDERKSRLKPLNDRFSMAECCLIADVAQFFKDRNIPFCPRNAVNDVLKAIGETHISGDFHRMVAEHPEKYFNESPHLKTVLESLKASGKRLIFVSNSPFWYVDAGMSYVVGPNWRNAWDVVIVSAGKPAFYTENSRPFREVSAKTGRIKFKKITELEPGEVYTEGCLRELTKCLPRWHDDADVSAGELGYDTQSQNLGASSNLASPNVLYIGDSLFADLVDAKREYGWTTAAVTPEVGYEMEAQSKTRFVLSERTINLLLNCLRMVQAELGNGPRSADDIAVMDAVENLVSKWRDEQTDMLKNPFGSVFRARFQPSLFAHSLKRYCDLYMSSVSALRHYSPQHRFYPDDARLLSHEVRGIEGECWDLEDVLRYGAVDE